MILNTSEAVAAQQLQSVTRPTMYERLFPADYELVPQLNEVYELELAFYESQCLRRDELIRNGAYFARVGDTFTRHFLMCSGEPVRLPSHSSSRLRAFFQTNQFKTGYATHGLFPYRGKFHPQMIKGLINVMGLKPGDTVLDPMMGSGTVLIEACLMGIRSVGVDTSPFCTFMAQAKLDALTVPLSPIRSALVNFRAVFDHFASLTRRREDRLRVSEQALGGLFSPENTTSGYVAQPPLQTLAHEAYDDPRVWNFLLLAYLDSVGYCARSNRDMPLEKFRGVLERYLFVADKIQHVLEGAESELAPATPVEGDARYLPVEDHYIDGVLFSPPYSFAIDYLENDLTHLNFMGADVGRLRERMVGLRGRTLSEKLELYKCDMARVLAECARVMRPGRFCTIVVGTNSNQLSRILNVPPEDVPGIDETLIDLGSRCGLRFFRRLTRQITGMANTMRAEHIIMLQRT